VLALLLGAAPAAAQEPEDDLNARSEKIASTYRLTEPVLKKVAALTREIAALVRRDPAILEATADTTKPAPPAVRALYARVGITEEEYEKFMIASAFAAMGNWAATQSPEGAQLVKQSPPLVRANMEFLKAHEATLKAMEADMKFLREKTEAAEARPPVGA
jgi:hypothetical protein